MCKFCSGYKTLYQQTQSTRVYIDAFPPNRRLVIECTPFPPFKRGAYNEYAVKSVFEINYCLYCGRKLDAEEKIPGGRRKYIRKCGICGSRGEQSNMVRTSISSNGWLCQECFDEAKGWEK